MAMAIINDNILATILMFLGVKDLAASSDNPDTKINLTFTRNGKLQELNLTVRELIDAVQDTDSANATAAPGGERAPMG